MTVIFLATLSLLIVGALGAAARRRARTEVEAHREYLKACTRRDKPHQFLIRVDVERGQEFEAAFWRHYGR